MTVGEIRDVFLEKGTIKANPIDFLTFLFWVFIGTLGLGISILMLLSPIIIAALWLRY